MNKSQVIRLVENHRAFFASGRTRCLSFRIEQLKILRKAVAENEQAIFEALRRDLGKPPFEAYGGDIAIVLNEIDFALRHVRRWAKPEKVRTPLSHFPGRSLIVREPFGVALIIGPWNFPFQLMLAPLVGAVAAGNCAVLKPSMGAPRSSRLMAEIISRHFDPAYVSILEGGAETAQMLLEERFDCLFYTGGSATGKIVMAAAARHLAPVTLELGGKNPCVVEDAAHLERAARRIAWGKFFNAGQSCVAVDYLLVRREIKQELLGRIVDAVKDFYGDDPRRSPDFARIVNDLHFDRLSRLLDRGIIVAGGSTERTSRYMAPTVIEGISGDEPVMEDEIFGPILPVIEYDDLSQALAFVNRRPKPLALYFFSRDRSKQNRVLTETTSGGCCINDAVIHETSVYLPFGGVGLSGIGKYHGKASFDAFSNVKSIVKSGLWADVPLRYPPYRDHLKWLKKLF